MQFGRPMCQVGCITYLVAEHGKSSECCQLTCGPFSLNQRHRFGSIEPNLLRVQPEGEIVLFCVNCKQIQVVHGVRAHPPQHLLCFESGAQHVAFTDVDFLDVIRFCRPQHGIQVKLGTRLPRHRTKRLAQTVHWLVHVD